MRIYLAGKMDAEGGAWRDALLTREPDDYRAGREAPYWELVRPSADATCDWGQLGVVPWPTEPNRRVLGLHEFVGPYRTTFAPEIDSKYTGYFHGSTVTGQHGMSNFEDHAAIIRECWKAIHRADLVFVYITSPDCFGTLAEIGMAKGIGGYVVGAFDRDSDWDNSDYWFSAQLCDAVLEVPPPIKVGTPPPPIDWRAPDGPDRDAAHRALVAWDRRQEAERSRVRGLLKEAILHWTARPERPAPVALVAEDAGARSAQVLWESAQSFAQIAHWSADPRVRNEARRMLRKLGA